MTLNADLIRARCGEIEDSINRLKQFQEMTREEFLSNQDFLDVATNHPTLAVPGQG